MANNVTCFFTGADNDVTGIISDVRGTQTLSDIMKAEEASLKERTLQTNTPVPIQKSKTSQTMKKW